MTHRKDLIIAVLATSCLTATLFLIVPTRSQTRPEYDPMKDPNHDGAINILDAIDIANVFGTTGDPTIDVNVMNFPQNCKIDYDTVELSWDALEPPRLSTGANWTANWHDSGGFNRMVVYARSVNSAFYSGNFSMDVVLITVAWTANPTTDPPYESGNNRIEDVQFNVPLRVAVSGSSGQFSFSNSPISVNDTNVVIKVMGPWYKFACVIQDATPLTVGRIDLGVAMYLWNE